MSNDKILVQLWFNDAKRKAFLGGYKKWEVWSKTPKLDLVHYRYKLPDGSVIVVEEHKQRKYSGYKPDGWETGITYYVLKPGDPFHPGAKSSISGVCERLMEAKIELQKKKEGEPA